MAGFGIQKKGTSPLLATRKKFAEGSDLDDFKESKTKFEEGGDSYKADKEKIRNRLRNNPRIIDPKKIQRDPKYLKAEPYKKGGSVKDTHVTKDGRVAKKGLYYYMNRAKKLGKSKPGKGTVSDKALKASAKTAKK